MRTELLLSFALLAGCLPPQQQQQPRPQPYYPPPQQQQPPPQWGNYQQPAPAWPLPWFNPNLPAAPNPFDPAQRCVDSINVHRNQLGLRPVQRWVIAELCTA